jgi:hypothetical protein
MKKIIKILVVGILSLLWSCKDSKVIDFKVTYPEEKLGVVKATYSDGSIAIGSFNRGYKDYKDKSNYPWSIIITIDLDEKNCTSNGLPSETESEIVNKFEDELVEKMSKISPIHNVGHLFNKNQLQIFLYIRDNKKINEWLQKEVKKENILRPFTFDITEDQNWTTTESVMTDK